MKTRVNDRKDNSKKTLGMKTIISNKNENRKRTIGIATRVNNRSTVTTVNNRNDNS